MPDHGFWDDCPPGVVSGMADRLRRRKRQVRQRPLIFVGVAVVLVFAIGYGAMKRDEADARSRLNCRETVPLLAKYRERTLDDPAAQRVREHLLRCPKCREHYEELYPNEAQNRPLAHTRLLAAAPSLQQERMVAAPAW